MTQRENPSQVLVLSLGGFRWVDIADIECRPKAEGLDGGTEVGILGQTRRTHHLPASPVTGPVTVDIQYLTERVMLASSLQHVSERQSWLASLVSFKTWTQT